MKKRLRKLLEDERTDEVADLAADRRRVLSTLVSLTFDGDVLIGWRAVEAMGAAAERIARDDPDCVRDHLRRLHWLLSEESGGICWRAPEAMAEIIRRAPAQFREYISIVASLIWEMADEDLVHFRPGILWALGRLGPILGEELDTVLPAIESCLDDPDPQVRGMAAWCLAECGRGEVLVGRDDLLADGSPVALYEDGRLVRASVGELADRAARRKTG